MSHLSHMMEPSSCLGFVSKTLSICWNNPQMEFVSLKICWNNPQILAYHPVVNNLCDTSMI